MPDEMNKLNPQIQSVAIGTRDLRKVKIYPLALGDEIEFADIITEAITLYVGDGKTEENDEKTVQFVIDLIKENLGRILNFVTYEPTLPKEVKEKGLLKFVTNLQASEIALVIWNQNFKEPSKNVQSLLDQVKTQFRLGGQQLPFVNDTDTSSTKSSESPTEKEDSQKGS